MPQISFLRHGLLLSCTLHDTLININSYIFIRDSIRCDQNGSDIFLCLHILFGVVFVFFYIIYFLIQFFIGYYSYIPIYESHRCPLVVPSTRHIIPGNLNNLGCDPAYSLVLFICFKFSIILIPGGRPVGFIRVGSRSAITPFRFRALVSSWDMYASITL